MTNEWQQRIDAVWVEASGLDDVEVIRRIDALVDELDPSDPRGPFEAGGARDAAGLEAEAEPRYRRALELGLAGRARIEALIQLASTVRNLGRPGEAIALLDGLDEEAGELADAVVAFRALAQLDAGDARGAASAVLGALAAHLPQYGRSLAAYAREVSGDASSA